MFIIEEELKKLPDKPGVYIMRDKDNHIIYVGKAISLKKRVRQYFRKNNKTKRIENMVALVDHFEYIVTDNESEALILECSAYNKRGKYSTRKLSTSFFMDINPSKTILSQNEKYSNQNLFEKQK